MLELYKKRLLQQGTYMGEALKNQSDMIMNHTFTNDIAYRKCYINDKPVDAKYITYTYYSISKDAVDYHLQFRPGVHYSIGTYVSIPDDVGDYNTWLIVGRSDEPQFVKYNILLCNWVFKWIYENEIQECVGVLRKRNSYNGGTWRDRLTTIVENQNQFIVPTNNISQTINYDCRLLISDNKINPIAWKVSKIEDTFPSGIIIFTLSQDAYDPNRDNKELMIADYYKSNIIPEDNITKPSVHISYNGDPAIKVGGTFKTFTVNGISFCDWAITGLSSTDYISEIPSSQLNAIKIKMNKDYSLIGRTFTLEASTGGTLIDSIEVEVVSL